MKKICLFGMMIVSALIVSCSSDDDIQNSPVNKEIKIIADLPQESSTRAAYTDNSEGSTYSLTSAWANGDKVRYDYRTSAATNNEQKRTVDVTITGGVGTFSLSDGDPAASSYIYCHHPASSNYFTSLADNTSTCVITPPTNAGYIYNLTSDLSSKNFLVGSLQYSDSKANLNMAFKNIYALLKFTIKVPYENSGEYSVSRFSTVTIKGYDGTNATNVKTGGTVTLTGSTGEFEWGGTSDGAYTRTANIDLTNNGTNEIAGGYRTCTLYVLVTPQTWSGLYLSATDNGSTAHTYVYSKTGNMTLVAGKMYGINIKLEKSMH